MKALFNNLKAIFFMNEYKMNDEIRNGTSGPRKNALAIRDNSTLAHFHLLKAHSLKS